MGTNSTSFQQGSGAGSPGVEEISKGAEKRGSAIPRPALRRGEASCAGWGLCFEALAF